MTSPPGAISAPAPVPPPPPCPHCAATTARAYALVRHLTHQADAAATDLVQSRAACNEWEVRYHQLESALVALQMRMDAVLADENDYGPHDPHYHVGNGAGIEGHDGDRNRAIHVRVPPPGPSSLPVFADALVQTRPAPPLAHAAAQTPHADVRPPPNRASQVSPPLHRALRSVAAQTESFVSPPSVRSRSAHSLHQKHRTHKGGGPPFLAQSHRRRAVVLRRTARASWLAYAMRRFPPTHSVATETDSHSTSKNGKRLSVASKGAASLAASTVGSPLGPNAARPRPLSLATSRHSIDASFEAMQVPPSPGNPLFRQQQGKSASHSSTLAALLTASTAAAAATTTAGVQPIISPTDPVSHAPWVHAITPPDNVSIAYAVHDSGSIRYGSVSPNVSFAGGYEPAPRQQLPSTYVYSDPATARARVRSSISVTTTSNYADAGSSPVMPRPSSPHYIGQDDDMDEDTGAALPMAPPTPPLPSAHSRNAPPPRPATPGSPLPSSSSSSSSLASAGDSYHPHLQHQHHQQQRRRGLSDASAGSDSQIGAPIPMRWPLALANNGGGGSEASRSISGRSASSTVSDHLMPSPPLPPPVPASTASDKPMPHVPGGVATAAEWQQPRSPAPAQTTSASAAFGPAVYPSTALATRSAPVPPPAPPGYIHGTTVSAGGSASAAQGYFTPTTTSAAAAPQPGSSGTLYDRKLQKQMRDSMTAPNPLVVSLADSVTAEPAAIVVTQEDQKGSRHKKSKPWKSFSTMFTKMGARLSTAGRSPPSKRDSSLSQLDLPGSSPAAAASGSLTLPGSSPATWSSSGGGNALTASSPEFSGSPRSASTKFPPACPSSGPRAKQSSSSLGSTGMRVGAPQLQQQQPPSFSPASSSYLTGSGSSGSRRRVDGDRSAAAGQSPSQHHTGSGGGPADPPSHPVPGEWMPVGSTSSSSSSLVRDRPSPITNSGGGSGWYPGSTPLVKTFSAPALYPTAGTADAQQQRRSSGLLFSSHPDVLVTTSGNGGNYYPPTMLTPERTSLSTVPVVVPVPIKAYGTPTVLRNPLDHAHLPSGVAAPPPGTTYRMSMVTVATGHSTAGTHSPAPSSGTTTTGNGENLHAAFIDTSGAAAVGGSMAQSAPPPVSLPRLPPLPPLRVIDGSSGGEDQVLTTTTTNADRDDGGQDDEWTVTLDDVQSPPLHHSTQAA